MNDAYLRTPSRGELAAIVSAGALHVGAELRLSEKAALSFSAAVALAFLIYLIWRATSTRGALRLWGMRRDNFWPALRVQLLFVLLAGGALLGLAAALGSARLPVTFWVTLALYPLWGTAQQFALQNLIARNLTGLLPNPLAVAVIASGLFGLSHYPRIDLVMLTLVAGVPFVLIYRRRPNLWAVGLAHGILGSLAVYLISDEDPGAAIVHFLLGG